MEFGSPTNTNTSCPTIKNEAENETTPTQIHQPKPLSFSNGLLKRRHHHHHHHHHPLPHHHAVVVTYKECLKNHAAAMGSHAVDGCGEFMPSTNTNPNDPTSLKCAACGCHRNFHRREPDDLFTPPPPLPALEYHPHHRHHPPAPPHPNSGDHSSPSSPSPPPISSSYNLLTLTGGSFSGDPTINNNNFPTPPGFTTTPGSSNPNSKKRFRTKFSQEQKEKMLEFAEKVGWKFQKKDEEMMMGICNEIGIDKGVLKVWMHNNKNTLGKKDLNENVINKINGNGNGNGYGGAEYHHHHHSQEDGGDTGNNTDGRSLDQLHQLLSSANGGSSS